MRRRITITLTEAESEALEQLGDRCHFRQDWMGHWRAKLVHRVLTAFLKLALRERVSFPLRLEFARQAEDFYLEAETVRPASPRSGKIVNIWHVLRSRRR